MNELRKQSQSYKIRVSNEAETLEVVQLLEQLGYKRVGSLKTFKDTKSIQAWSDGEITRHDCHEEIPKDFQEITLPQLRDMVVLHRNDVNDANWQNEIGDQIYNSSSDKFYIYRSNGWDELQQHEMRQAMWEKSKSIAEPQPDQELISGADALRALADGKCVQWMTGDEFNDVTDEWQIREFNHPSFKFRLKPSTITLTLTIPAPFDPKLGEEYWYLDSHSSRGYNFATFEEDVFDKGLVQFGVWRTEEEVKQVVAALRQIKGASV